jgi:hypothetical protein
MGRHAMSEQQLRELIEISSKNAERDFAKHGRLEPAWYCVDGDDRGMFLPSPSVDKDTAAALMRALFVMHGVKRYVFVDEAWMVATQNPSDQQLKDYERGIAEDPNRMEIVMFSGEDRDAGGHRFILRPPGRRAHLGPLTVERYEHSGGRFVGMLPVTGARQ